MNINPPYNRAVIKRSEEDKVTLGGIVLPDSAVEKPIKAEVVAVGKGKILDNEVLYPLEVQIGDKVLFGKYAGNEIKISDENLLVLHESDIMAVFEA